MPPIRKRGETWQAQARRARLPFTRKVIRDESRRGYVGPRKGASDWATQPRRTPSWSAPSQPTPDRSVGHAEEKLCGNDRDSAGGDASRLRSPALAGESSVVERRESRPKTSVQVSGKRRASNDADPKVCHVPRGAILGACRRGSVADHLRPASPVPCPFFLRPMQPQELLGA